MSQTLKICSVLGKRRYSKSLSKSREGDFGRVGIWDLERGKRSGGEGLEFSGLDV